MPSQALTDWKTVSAQALDEIAHAHRLIGGAGPGRRYATQQVNQAYVVLLSSQFQKFCRDLHTECADVLCGDPMYDPLNGILKARLTRGRKLDVGNPNPTNIGYDYQWFGLAIWDEVKKIDKRNQDSLIKLLQLNVWRNAIAHQDFTQLGGRTTITLQLVNQWRAACTRLALAFDRVMHDQLLKILGDKPW